MFHIAYIHNFPKLSKQYHYQNYLIITLSFRSKAMGLIIVICHIIILHCADFFFMLISLIQITLHYYVKHTNLKDIKGGRWLLKKYLKNLIWYINLHTKIKNHDLSYLRIQPWMKEHLGRGREDNIFKLSNYIIIDVSHI